MMFHGPWGGTSWMWIFPLLFFVVMMLLLFRGTGWLGCGGRAAGPGEESAREIVDRRYARGEISREEYQRIKGELAG